MKLTNTTHLPDHVVRAALRFVMPPGVTNARVILKPCEYGTVNGYAHIGQNTVMLKVGRQRVLYKVRFNGEVKRLCWLYPSTRFVYQYGQLKGRRYWLANEVECLVYLAAHELRHLWQDKTTARRRAGMAFGSRGRFSEIDAESYSIRKLRAWRKQNLKK